MKFSYYFIIVWFIAACSSQQADKAADTEKNTVIPAQQWIQKRVSSAKQRLQGSPEGQMIWKAMETHGGLSHWYSQGPLQFHFNYQPLDGKTPRNTIQISDNWSARAHHQLAQDTTLRFGWDGQQAWALPDTSKIPFDVRFWALTPYYFVGIPFVLADEGVLLESAGQDTLQGVMHDLVKVTYAEGVGDAPDDYYVLYLHPETRQIGAFRYVVSYPAYFPQGGHTPEKIMVLQGAQTVNGIFFPEGYHTYMWEKDSTGKYVTNIKLTEVNFRPDLENDFFKTPPGAQAVTDL